jgi:hypothetical protein
VTESQLARIAELRAIQSTRPLTKAEAGTLGGLQTLIRLGKPHFSKAGAKGFQAYCQKNGLCAEQALFRLAKGGRLKVDFNARWKNSPVYKALQAGANKICICTNHVTAGNDCWTCGGYVL